MCGGGNFLYQQQAILGQHQGVQEFNSILTPIFSEMASDSTGSVPQNCPPPLLTPAARPGCDTCASELLAAIGVYKDTPQLRMPITSCCLYFWPTGCKSVVPMTLLLEFDEFARMTHRTQRNILLTSLLAYHKGYNSGLDRWGRYTEQGMGKECGASMPSQGTLFSPKQPCVH